MQLALSAKSTDSMIVKLLLKVGGVELLDIHDEDGYGTVDFCNKAQSKVILKVLKDMEKNANVQKHIELF